MSERIDSRLVVNALENEASLRLSGEGLVAHSDRRIGQWVLMPSMVRSSIIGTPMP